MGLFKLIILFLLIYFAFRFIFRLLLPFGIRNFIYKHNSNVRREYKRKKEKKVGDVTIIYDNDKHKDKPDDKKTKKDQYIDFEEIE